ncbi:SGNH/GDSL hydrolase family protein [Cohnella silvisoli]|uniref:SGNH/GDSL hydrolase family protein n=1 Tax=Cohnella silvisoli TaxID=2873699 RepID=A0ABV1L0I2_9BACL|nr:SGNH/GDSL hydrolase family protein [Cohnella silvisoli]MCD9025123.1 SGNH/GDSL hydrolase family protein [Cohnella silvisoli]
MKKILLLGDSIRIAYMPLVQTKLSGIAEVVGPEDNGRFAKYTLWYVDFWIDTLGKPDVIHWNNGIWDVYHHSAEHGVFTPLEEYVGTIRQILDRLKRSGTSIIWATTTPVSPNNVNCSNLEIDKYNETILGLMRSENVAINDLNATVKHDMDDYIGEDHLHLTPKGSEACADAVVKAVLSYL